MSERHVNDSRRAFFMKGSAAIGATLASAGAGATLLDGGADLRALHARLATLEDREALRGLQQAFAALLETGTYDALPALFSRHARVELHEDEADGGTAIATLFRDGYGQGRARTIHAEIRADPAAADERIDIAGDRSRAHASFARRVRVARPLHAQSSAAQMARLQGLDAESRWERGQYEVDYTRDAEGWRIARLRFVSA